MRRNPNFPVYGISPLGGNANEDGTLKGVPLFYDERVDTYISEQAIEELDDRDISLAMAREYEKKQQFLIQIGYRRT